MQGYLADHGIDINAVAAKATTATYYSTYFEGNLRESDIIAWMGNETLGTVLGSNRAVTLVDAFGKYPDVVVIGYQYFTQISAGPDLATSQNITLVHEAIHNALSADDTRVASQMGLGNFPDTPGGVDAASIAISAFLATCYQ